MDYTSYKTYKINQFCTTKFLVHSESQKLSNLDLFPATVGPKTCKIWMIFLKKIDFKAKLEFLFNIRRHQQKLQQIGMQWQWEKVWNFGKPPRNPRCSEGCSENRKSNQGQGICEGSVWSEAIGTVSVFVAFAACDQVLWFDRMLGSELNCDS